MLQRIFCLVVVCAFSASLFAQDKNSKELKKQERKERISELIKKEEEGALIFNKQFLIGLKLNTDGYGLFYEHGKYKTITTTNIWWAEIGERKNPKEEKASITTFDGVFFLVGNPFVYGKVNNFYYLKAGLGQQKLIGGKGNMNGVSVSAIYGAGLTAGFLKPYYLTISDPSTGRAIDVKYPDSLFLDPNVILGGAGAGKGFSEMTIVPGAQAKVGVRFDYGKYNEVISALEIGVNSEYYTKKMPIMALSNEKQFFFNAYVAVEFGKRK